MAGNIEEWVEVTEDGKYMRLGGSYLTETSEDEESELGAGCIFNGLNIVAEYGDIPGKHMNWDSGFRCCVMGNP